MRILVVNKFYWNKGGSERVLFDLADGYARAGHEVVPFAMASPDNRPSEWSRFFVPEVDWARGGTLSKLRTAVRVVWSAEAAGRLRALLEAARPDVAHLHNFHHQLSPSIVNELRKAGIPAVHTLHDYKVVCPNYLLLTGGAVCERCAGGRFAHAVRHRCVRGSRAASAVAWAESAWHRRRRTLERGISAFVSPSRFLAGKVVEMGFRGAPLHVVPNGVDPGEFRPAEGSGEGFLYAGRLSREKGVLTLLQAIARRPALRLAVAGEGPEEEAVRAAAGERAPGRVRFLGHLPRTDLLEEIRRARAVVLPAEWYENAPMSVLEAAASGVPVVGASIGGIPELVSDGSTGLLFEPGDAEALGDRLQRLEDDPELARSLGKAARNRVGRDFTLAGQVDKMLAILGEVASSASR